MGEALLKAHLSTTIPDMTISSAGLNAMTGWPADPTSQELMKQKGLDISTHRARHATIELISEADLILTMTAKQQSEIEKTFPYARGKTHSLGKWGEYDVIDPYKRSRVVFEHSLALIEQGVNEWCKKLWPKTK